MSYQTTPVVTATSVTYPFVQDLVLGFPGSLTAKRELVAFDPLTATMRWTVSKCASSTLWYIVHICETPHPDPCLTGSLDPTPTVPLSLTLNLTHTQHAELPPSQPRTSS